MKYICRKTCQHRDEGQIFFCEMGTVYEFKDAPKNNCFEAIDKEKELYVVDFLTAGETELKQAKWKFSDAEKSIWDAYGVKLSKEDGDKKSDIIGQIMDARYRSVELKVASTTDAPASDLAAKVFK